MADAYSEEKIMIDTGRVKLMSKMAHYDQKVSEEDIQICGYFKNDYVSLKTLTTALWVTVAYCIIVLAALFCFVDEFLSDLTPQKLLMLIIVVVVAYVVLIIVYCVCAHKFYKNKYAKSKNNIIKYYKQIVRLQKINAKENRKK